MELTLIINIENSAFEDANGTELAVILRKLADRADGSQLDGVSWTVMDSNGNKVGKLEID